MLISCNISLFFGINTENHLRIFPWNAKTKHYFILRARFHHLYLQEQHLAPSLQARGSKAVKISIAPLGFNASYQFLLMKTGLSGFFVFFFSCGVMHYLSPVKVLKHSPTFNNLAHLQLALFIVTYQMTQQWSSSVKQRLSLQLYDCTSEV